MKERAPLEAIPSTPCILDLHCHTVRGSVDSQLTPEELAAAARSSGLSACCITEHDNVWERHDARRYAQQEGMPVLRGMEVTTDLGHILVYGLDRYASGIRDARVLRRVTEAAGGIMIVAHPFRNLLYRPNALHPGFPSIEEAAEWEIFRLVDEVEVLNGGTAELENFFALKVANYLGFRGVACSDAHSLQGIGRYATCFSQQVSTVEQLVARLKGGSFFPAERLVRPHPNPLPEGEGMANGALPEGEGMKNEALSLGGGMPDGALPEGWGRVLPAFRPYTVDELGVHWEERLQDALRT